MLRRLLLVSVIAAAAICAAEPTERKTCWTSKDGCPMWIYDLQSFFPNFDSWIQFASDVQGVYEKHKIEMPKQKTSPFQYMSYFPNSQKWLDFVFDLVNCYQKHHIPLDKM